MDETLIKNWNERIQPRDLVYVIGDFSWKNPEIYVKQLNGRIILIAGGHDYRWKSKFGCFEKVYDALTIYIHNHPVVLCHFCFRVWNKSHYNSWHLFGHSHGKLEPIGKSWDVGFDLNGKLLSEDDIVEIMNNRPDNPNLVRRNQ